MRKHLLFSGWLLIILLGQANCAALLPTPEVELGNYREAVLQTQKVGVEALTVWNEAKHEVTRRLAVKSASSAQPYPDKFDARAAITGKVPVDAAAVRLLALESVVRYTALLTTLAEGKSVDRVGEQAGAFVANLNAVSGLIGLAPIPGGAAIASAVSFAASEFEKARSRAQFRSAVKSGEIVIVKLLEFLIDDISGPDAASGYYTTLFGLNDPARLHERREITDAVGLLLDIVANHGKPSDDQLLPAVEKRIRPILTSLGLADNFEGLKPAGNKPFSSVTHSQVLNLADKVEAAGMEHDRYVRLLNDYHALLGQYAILLGQTIQNLKALSAALDEPLNVRVLFENTLRLALRAQDEVRMVRESL